MRFINKDAIIKDLQMFRYLYDEHNEPTVKFTEKQMKAVCRFIEHYIEVDGILCDTEYWLNPYQIYTREWPSEDENTDPKLSFIISRKPLVDTTNKAENAVTEHEDINTEEDTQKEQLNE